MYIDVSYPFSRRQFLVRVLVALTAAYDAYRLAACGKMLGKIRQQLRRRRVVGPVISINKNDLVHIVLFIILRSIVDCMLRALNDRGLK